MTTFLATLLFMEAAAVSCLWSLWLPYSRQYPSSEVFNRFIIFILPKFQYVLAFIFSVGRGDGRVGEGADKYRRNYLQAAHHPAVVSVLTPMKVRAHAFPHSHPQQQVFFIRKYY